MGTAMSQPVASLRGIRRLRSRCRVQRNDHEGIKHSLYRAPGHSPLPIAVTKSTCLGMVVLILASAAGCTRTNFFAKKEPVVESESESRLAAVEAKTIAQQDVPASLPTTGSTELNQMASEKLALSTPQAETLRPTAASTEQSLVSTVSARMPSQPRLTTLEPGESLSASVSSSSGPVLLDFYATWCGPCRSQGKILHDLEPVAESNDARIIKIDVDQHPHLARQFQVRSLPTLVVLRDGEVAHRRQGLTKADELASLMAR